MKSVKNININFIQPINYCGYQKYQFHNTNNYDQILHIVPWFKESWGTLSYFIAYAIARQANIKIVSYGNKNLLPFLSLISHEAIVSSSEINQIDFFNLRSDINNFDMDNFKENKIIYNENIIPHIASILSKEFYFLYQKYLLKEYSPTGPKSNFYLMAMQVLEQSGCLPKPFYKVDNIYMDALIEKIWLSIKNRYPDNAVWCEIKNEWYEDVEDIIIKYAPDGLLYETLSKKPYCKTIQRQLYSEHSDYYMSIQILLSLYKNIKFIGVGGAANIFSVIPTKSYFLLSKETYFNDSVKYKKEFEKNYFDNYFNFVFTPSVRYINAKYDVTQRSRQHISNIENFFRHRK